MKNFCVLAMSLFILTATGLYGPSVISSFAQDETLTIENALLWRKYGSMIYFKYLKEGKELTIWGEISGGTRITDISGRLLTAGELASGSIWKVTLEINPQEHKDPIILRMERIRMPQRR